MSDPRKELPSPPDGGSDSQDELHVAADWTPSGAELDASGRLTRGAAAVRPQFVPPPSAAAPAPPPDEPLELALDPARVHAEILEAKSVDPSPQYAVAAPPRSRWRSNVFRIVLAVFISAIGTLGTIVVQKGGLGLLPRSVQLPRALEPQMPVLRIESEPSGATVFVNDAEIGETPLLRENDFPKGVDIPTKVVLRGYRPWTGTFKGGKSAVVEAKLKRR